jgi:hypothetical protein
MTPTYPTSSSSSPGQAGAADDPTRLVDQTQQKVGAVVEQAQAAAGQVTEQAKQQAASQLETQKERTVDSLVTVAQALRQTGQHLHEQQQGAIATYVEQAAERVEGLTNHLRSRDVTQLLGDTEDLARHKPGLFLGAAVALGFVGARFLMSSGQRARAQRSYGMPNGMSTSSSPYAPPSQYGTGGAAFVRPGTTSYPSAVGALSDSAGSGGATDALVP